MPDLDHLAAVARGLLPEGAAVAAADPGQLYPLLPGEALPGAIPSRGREFSAGRHAARTALALLGLPSCPIPQGDDRAPVWPSGISGSITHTHLACLAAVIRGPVLGLDLEEDLPLDTFLWDSILGPEEQAWASGAPDPGFAAKLIFSAKEAARKPPTRRNTPSAASCSALTPWPSRLPTTVSPRPSAIPSSPLPGDTFCRAATAGPRGTS